MFIIIQDYEDVCYVFTMFWYHFTESSIYALKLIQRYVILGSRLGIRQICYNIYFLALKKYILCYFLKIAAQNCPLSFVHFVNLITGFYSLHYRPTWIAFLIVLKAQLKLLQISNCIIDWLIVYITANKL